MRTFIITATLVTNFAEIGANYLVKASSFEEAIARALSDFLKDSLPDPILRVEVEAEDLSDAHETSWVGEHLRVLWSSEDPEGETLFPDVIVLD